MLDPTGILAKAVLDTIFQHFTGKGLDCLIAHVGRRRAFAKALAGSLRAMQDNGLGIGQGGIENHFLCRPLVVAHLWEKLLTPGYQGDIDYDRLAQELRQEWEPEVPLCTDAREAIEFFVDDLMDRCWREDALRPVCKDRILEWLDPRITELKARLIAEEYAETTLKKLFRDMAKDMGKGVEYVVPVLTPERMEREEHLREMERQKHLGDPREILACGHPDDRVAVIAGSGVGKTLLLQQTAKWIHDRNVGLIPIFLEHDEACNCRNRDEVASTLLGRFESSGVRANKLTTFVHRMRQEGRFIFLIDALDQMGDRVYDVIGGLDAKAFGACRLVVTSRKDTWDSVKERLIRQGFQPMSLQDFDREQIVAYLGERNLEELPFGIDEEILGVPVLLKMVRELIMVQGSERLKDIRTRAQLYHQFIDDLIEREANRRNVDRTYLRGCLPDLMKLAYESLALDYTKKPIPVRIVDTILGDGNRFQGCGPRENLIRWDFVKSIAEMGRGKEFIDFRHRSFQEYLAGEELGGRWKSGKVVLERDLVAQERWEEPLRLMLGTMGQDDIVRALEQIDTLDHDTALGCLPDTAWLGPGQVDRLLRSGVERDDWDGARLRARALHHLRGRFSRDRKKDLSATLQVLGSYVRETALIKGANCWPLWTAVSVLGKIERDHPGLSGKIEDLRSPLRLKGSDDAWSHFYDREGQPIRMCRVPAGPFFLGHTGEELKEIKEKFEWSYEDELHGRRVDLPGFAIDQFPVTNMEYEKFDPGHKRCDQSKGNNQPVVELSWFEASLFAFWLGKRLPTELEWEKACRGPAMVDGKENRRWFPWGDGWDPQKCNNDSKGTSPVGSYPQDVSPVGCHDMAGNVWEWCSSLWRESYEDRSEREDPLAAGRRVVRGGSWGSRFPYFFRCSIRSGSDPCVGGSYLGFRCVQDR
jgi:hypothetical protein